MERDVSMVDLREATLGEQSNVNAYGVMDLREGLLHVDEGRGAERISWLAHQ